MADRDMQHDEELDTNTEVADDGANYLEMSDEDILKMAAASTLAPAAPAPVEAQVEEEVVEEGEGTTTPEAPAADGDEGDTAASTTPPAEVQGEAEATGEAAAKPGAEGEAAATEAPKTIDYEAEYKRLLAPFKANGREVKVDSVDDALQLMQMGANYNKKMAALKPSLKILKLLENNGLLDENKLSFLIDLDKKNPGAINKLVKESGIDPMDLDAEKAGAYKQTAYTVDDREIELDTVLDELQGSETYTRTLEVVGNKWDAASRQTIAQAPQLLKVINDHMASGVYDLISTELERQRMLGRLNGLSDIEAYRQVGDAIQARGGFNHLFQPKAEPEQGNEAPAPVVPVAPKPVVRDANLINKRMAASPTRAAVPAAAPAEFNPLAMSDEEFAKTAALRFR